MFKKYILLFFVIFISFLFAINNTFFTSSFYKYDLYFKEASQQFNIPFILLKSIALTENYKFNSKIKRKNKNKTYDYGLMQINSIWLKKFKLKPKHLFDPRTNIFVAAYILRRIINKYGYSWDSIGLYHSSTNIYKYKWLKKLKQNILYIIKHDKRYIYIITTKGQKYAFK